MKTINRIHSQKTLIILCIIFLIPVLMSVQWDYPPDIDCDKVVVYKTIDDIELKLWIFQPPKHSSDDQAPAIVFYFGGGWSGGSPEQFVKQCEYLADRGMVAMVADYRVMSRHDVKANSCVADAKSSIRWVREHAGELGVDPDRIAAGGGSAGGHLAAATGTLPKFDEPGENMDVSSKPNAMALFNPVLVLAPYGDEKQEMKEGIERFQDRLGAKPEDISPYHNIVPGIAPTIIFHGTGDNTVPFKTAEIFTEKMKEAGNKCILAAYENEGHGFFNYGRNKNGPYFSTVSNMDKFFVKLGWLDALPEPL